MKCQRFKKGSLNALALFVCVTVTRGWCAEPWVVTQIPVKPKDLFVDSCGMRQPARMLAGLCEVHCV
jgi:hypothetical protein